LKIVGSRPCAPGGRHPSEDYNDDVGITGCELVARGHTVHVDHEMQEQEEEQHEHKAYKDDVGITG